MKVYFRKFLKAIAFFLLIPFSLEATSLSLKENPMAHPGHISYDVCDLDRIYSADYQYSLPKGILEGFLSGRAFDYPVVYTSDEDARLREDINEIFQAILAEHPPKTNVAILTAGTPGAGKTIKLRQHREENTSLGRFAYICPDDVCLKSQRRTYVADVESGDRSPLSLKAAYDKWRPGSNAANHLILANLIRERYAFYFGTTSTSPATANFFEFLKKQGYQVTLLHVSAPDDIRWKSIEARDAAGFIQTTEKDVREKGVLLSQRITDTYLRFADRIEFHYRDKVDGDACLAAVWTRNEEDLEKLGKLEITEPASYEHIKSIHNAAIETLHMPELAWESTVEANSTVVITPSTQ